MFKPKNRLPLFGFLLSVIILLCFNNNVFAHGKLDNYATEGENEQTVAQQNAEEIEIKTIQVRENIYMLVGDGGNIGVSTGEDGVIMIDSQFAPLFSKIETAIKEITPQPINYLLNTHYHFDHTNGNANIAKAGATIIAHDNVPKQMRIPHTYEVLGSTREAAPIEALPRVTFSDNFRMALNNNYIHAFAMPPAHTDGDVVVHFTKQNVIHTGDLFFNGFYPFIDTGVGGSVEGMIEAIDRILPLINEDTLIIPGHGKLGNEKELMAFQEMLKTVNDRVKTGIEENLSLQEMINANVLADLDDTWGKGFLSSEKFLTIAYNGIIDN